MKPKSSILSSVFLLTNTITGVAFLAIPFHFKEAGLIGASLCMALVFIFNLFSLEFMANCWWSEEQHLMNEYAKDPTGMAVEFPNLRSVIARKTSRGFLLVYDTLVFLSCFGALVAFTMTVADAFSSLISLSVIDGTSFIVRALVVVGFALLEFPLSAWIPFASQTKSAAFSLLCLYTIAILVAIHAGPAIPFSSLDMTAFGSGGFFSPAPTTITTFVFAYSCQMNAFSVYNAFAEGRDRASFSKGSLTFINMFSLFMATCVYILIGVFGYSEFVGATNTSLINNYGDADGIGIALRVILSLKMLLTFPLLLAPAAECLVGISSYFVPSLRKHTGNKKLNKFLVLLVIVASSVTATVARDLSFVLSLVGSVTDVFISFAFPALLVRFCGKMTLLKVSIALLLLFSSPLISEFSIFGLFVGRT